MKTVKGLAEIEQSEHKKVVVVFFILNLMKLLGYKPELNYCAVCAAKENFQVFSLSDNSVLCQKCNALQKVSISSGAIALMNFIYTQEKFENFCVSRKKLNELIAFLKNWVPYVLESQINCLKYI